MQHWFKTTGRMIVGSILVFSVCSLALATPRQQGEEQPYDDTPVVTRHQISIGAKTLKYTARAGFLTLRDETRQARGRIFYVSYTVDRGIDTPPRPLTFAWNGGPGAPSSPLHLGLLGPRRAKGPEEYTTSPPPYELTDNESTWLEMTDLVLVDPVGTGYSYPITPEFGKQFWSVQGDIDSIAEFIRLYLVRYEAWERPLFIVGESYGALRAAGLAEVLPNRDIPLTGIVLISPVLNFITIQSALSDEAPGNDLPFILDLPTYTASAFFHKRLAPGLQLNFQKTLAEAEKWAETQYAGALMAGDNLTGHERELAISELAKYTGLNTALIDKNNLRVDMAQFAESLLQGQHRIVGLFDTRLSRVGTPGSAYDPHLDPSLSHNGTGDLIVPYLRSELDFKTDDFYAGPFGGGWPPASTPREDWMEWRWDWGSAYNGYVERSQALARAMRKDCALRIFVASGFYDLQTPFWSIPYTFNHMGLDHKLHSNVVLKFYAGGHSMYMVKDVRVQMKQDMAEFMQSTIGGKCSSTTEEHF